MRKSVNINMEETEMMYRLVAAALLTLLVVNKSQATLVAYYPFNGNANDESGNGNNGVVHGATLTFDRFGNPNRAYHFNGIDNFIVASANNLPTK